MRIVETAAMKQGEDLVLLLDSIYGKNPFYKYPCEMCPLHYSGNGVKAFIWLDGFIDFIKKDEYKPSNIIIVGSMANDYKQFSNRYKGMYAIQEKVYGDFSNTKDNAVFLLDKFQELKDIADNKGISFISCTREDAEKITGRFIK